MTRENTITIKLIYMKLRQDSISNEIPLSCRYVMYALIYKPYILLRSQSQYLYALRPKKFGLTFDYDIVDPKPQGLIAEKMTG